MPFVGERGNPRVQSHRSLCEFAVFDLLVAAQPLPRIRGLREGRGRFAVALLLG